MFFYLILTNITFFFNYKKFSFSFFIFFPDKLN